MSTIKRIRTNRKKYLNLLLLGDEQEAMIDRYLERGDMYVLHNESGEAVSVCVTTDEGQGVLEIKNIAVIKSEQRKGHGRQMLQYVKDQYKASHHTIIVGTGEVPSTLDFYRSCGFTPSHRIENFFTSNYDHTIIEEGIELKDMVYLKYK